MKPQLLKITNEPVSSFSLRQDFSANINCRWHYHPELELIYFHKGSGTQFIGDQIRRFSEGDLLLLGDNLPHYFMYDDACLTDEQEHTPFATVIHFRLDFMGEHFIHLPESRPIKSLLERANRGLVFDRDQVAALVPLLWKMVQSQNMTRLLSLIECLSRCAEAPSQALSSIGFRYNHQESEKNRLSTIYNFTIKNFKNRIDLKEIASITGLTPNSLCRYFKVQTGKTYYQFLLEIRIGYACKLLLDNNHSIKQICFESGFHNFSSFHKSFKAITGFTPQNYQQQYNVSSTSRAAIVA